MVLNSYIIYFKAGFTYTIIIQGYFGVNTDRLKRHLTNSTRCFLFILCRLFPPPPHFLFIAFLARFIQGDPRSQGFIPSLPRFLPLTSITIGRSNLIPRTRNYSVPLINCGGPILPCSLIKTKMKPFSSRFAGVAVASSPPGRN